MRHVLALICLILFSISINSNAQQWKQEREKFYSYLQNQNFSEAISTGEHLLSEMEKSTGRDTSYADALYYLGYANFNLKEYTKAAQWAKEEKLLRKELFGKDSKEFINAAYVLAIYASYIPQYDKAAENLELVVAYMRTNIKPYDAELVNMVNQLAGIYALGGAKDKAKQLYENNYSAVKQHYSTSDSLYQQMTNTISTFYLQNGYCDLSEVFFLESLKQAENLYKDKDNKTYQIYIKNVYDFYVYCQNVSKAADYLDEYIRLEGLLNDKKSDDYLTLVNSFGEYCLNEGLYTKAEKVYSDFEKLVADAKGKNSADYATALNNLAVAYEKQEKYKEAEKLYLKCLKIKESVYKKQSGYYALSLINLAVLYDYMGKLDQAEKYFNEGIGIYESLDRIEDENYAIALSNLASLYSNKGKAKEAIQVLEKSLALTKKNSGEKSINYINALNNLGTVYSELGQFDLAEETLLKAIRLREEVNGKNHPELAVGLFNLANLKSSRGKYKEAEEIYLKALSIQESTQGKESVEYANVLQSMAALYLQTGEYRKAEENYSTCLSVYQKKYGKLHPEYAKVLNNIGYFYFEKGDYEKAGKCYNEALQIHYSAYGKESHLNIALLSNKANLETASRQFKQAEQNLLLAKQITEKTYGNKHADYAVTLNNLATLYYHMGNHEKAKAYYEEALVIRETVYGKTHTEVASSLNNLGTLYLSVALTEPNGEKALNYARKAKSYFYSALKVDSIAIGINHPQTAIHYNNLAEAHRLCNEPAIAESFYFKSLDIEKKSFKTETISQATTYHNLALLYAGQKQFEKAEEYAIKSKQIHQSVFGVNDPTQLSVVSSLAFIYEQQNKTEKAFAEYKESLKLLKRELELNFDFLSETEKEKYIETFNTYNDMYIDFAVKNQSTIQGLAKDVYNNELFLKGMLFRSSDHIRKEILNTKNKEAIALYAAWIDNKQKLGKSYSGKLNLSSEEQKSLEEAINLQEKKLSDFSGAIAKKETALSDAQIMKLLKKEQAAIEFITYKRKEDQKEMLCAILLKADQKEPNIVPLCSNDFLLQLKGKSNGNTVDFVASLYGTKENNSIELYNSIWKPLEANLTNVKEIYYSPSGALHKVAFSSLRNNDGVYLSERFVLHQLGATSALANQTGSSIAFKNNRFLIMGGVNYSIEEKKNTIWDYLPGTQTETEKITAIAKKSGMQAMYYSGKNATEERIKSSSEEEVPELIHVATHGFFYDNPEEVIEELEVKTGEVNFRGGSRGVYTFIENTNPLMRSGIVLAGANDNFNRLSDDEEDGILTAYEVSLMNLSKTKLAVLSACETGLGDVKGNQGVYGLQRAFKIAGVEYLIMSLWKVPDKETEEFMVNFYSELVSKKDVKLAFRATQSYMRAKYDPYYWAAFVLFE